MLTTSIYSEWLGWFWTYPTANIPQTLHTQKWYLSKKSNVEMSFEMAFGKSFWREKLPGSQVKGVPPWHPMLQSLDSQRNREKSNVRSSWYKLAEMQKKTWKPTPRWWKYTTHFLDESLGQSYSCGCYGYGINQVRVAKKRTVLFFVL